MNRIVAGVQMRSRPFDVSGNLGRARELLAHAVKRDAQLVLLPELFNVGYCMDARLFDVWEPIDGRTVTWMRETAARTLATVAGTFAERRQDVLLNTLVIAEPNGRIHTYGKHHPTEFERAAFDAGDGSNSFMTSLGRLGAVVCADIEYGESLLAPLGGNIDLLLYSQASNAPRWLARRIFARELKRGRPMFADAVEAVGSPAVYAGLVGPVQSTTRVLPSYLIGGTWVVDRHGHALAHVPFDQEGVAVAEVDMTPAPGDVSGLRDPGGIGGALMNLLVRKLPDLRQRRAERPGPLSRA